MEHYGVASGYTTPTDFRKLTGANETLGFGASQLLLYLNFI